ncbi:MAG: hypothetical protein QM762_13825 [Chryseolinea sp.]
MDRTNKRILKVIILLTIVLSAMTFVSDALQHKVIYDQSWTIEESKRNSYFLTEYRPLTRKLKLMQHADSVEIFRLWTEKEKKREKVWLFYKTVISDRVHFQIDYRQYPSDKFIFQIEGYGGHGGQGEMDTDFTVDTVTFQIVERGPVDTLGQRIQIPGELIKFIRVE